MWYVTRPHVQCRILLNYIVRSFPSCPRKVFYGQPFNISLYSSRTKCFENLENYRGMLSFFVVNL
jgi:hypothetical protein